MSKYPAIKATLKERLLSSAYPENEPLPSEPQLAREFGVSRMTARRALDELDREGYVYRVQGAGTYPSGKRFQQGTFQVRLFADWSRHPDKRVEVLRAERLLATPDIAAVLHLQPGDPVMFVHRLRADKTDPVVIEKRYVDAEVLPDLLEHDLVSVSVHDLLASQTRVPLTRVEQHLETVNLRQEEAQLLRVPLGTAAFLMRRTVYSSERRVSYVNYWIRSDRFTFQERFTP
ncbi:GntR family transcriptional regulator [Deinococcus peraridilitoris]|uniref:Transcriptional regulator n=1 Tax=Deinococcus peraridilitoris (strain DSM 19664 / LMG 22246 / CIP 109416 / KR-200) TaxID=937777 RepID=L0A823_DEIPD|nr:GntR family transcriptional regulator [Deinococcus peraridilitoris]AFZ69200.1 transcriptional regulator [Deinococcus peraridilitoris DSM 19664]